MVIPHPMSLVGQACPSNDPNWIYETKHDGFRAFGIIEHGHGRFISRKRQKLYELRDLAKVLTQEVHVDVAVLDGELAVPHHTGRTVFAVMMKRRHETGFYAFDLLWLDGEDLRRVLLLTRKEKLKRILPTHSPHILYADLTCCRALLHEIICAAFLSERARNVHGEPLSF